MSTVISVENLGKKYLLKHQERQGGYLALRDVLADGARNLGRRLVGKGGGDRTIASEEFWALNDVSFEVKVGDRVGIIGRNGAGKSTLLKVLSRITEPSAGCVRLRGRVASLLEVGTGFHPELTGRENIYLNGAVLGMSMAEIRTKFDEIVHFAEVERFLDTPVKRYSSGMYVRLAFAVAAHLDPEILVVDEVLAVGDAQFQKKCLGKMEDVSREGRTILFVSHNMQTITSLCNRGIVLRSGGVVLDGLPGQAVDAYLRDIRRMTVGEEGVRRAIEDLPGDPAFRFLDVRLSQDARPVGDLFDSAKAIEITLRYLVRERTTGLRVYFDVCDQQETILFRSFHDEDHNGIPTMEPGEYVSTTTIPADILGPLEYELRILAGIYNVRHCVPERGICIPLRMEVTGGYNRAYAGDTFRGKLAIPLKWVTERTGNVGQA